MGDNGETKSPNRGAGFASFAKCVTRITVGFSDLLGSLEPISPDVQTNPKFNDAEDEIKNMQPTK